MKNEFVPFELALKLKQLGFVDECMAYYTISLTEVEHKEDGTTGPFGWKKGEVFFEKRFFKNNSQGIDRSNEDWLEVGAPLYQQCYRWFREKYNLISVITTTPSFDTMYASKYKSHTYYQFQPFKWVDGKYLINDTYEEAELACIDKLIELVELKKEK